MKLLTVALGCALLLSSVALLAHGSMAALDFSAVVNMNWSTSSAFHTNPIVHSYIDTLHQTKVYAVIFDAGSTGTRVHVYKFRYEPHSARPYVLVDELFDEVKPGLSSHAARPEGVRPGLLRLLRAAKRKIPKLLWARTPMALRATAGLRLLPADGARRILAETEAVLATSGLQLATDGVAVLSGRDEAVWSWVTVNFLLQRVRQPHRSSGTVDLGGGSVQICFVPAAMRSVDRDSVHRVPLASVGGDSVDLYSHSHLGMGLMSARHAILTQGQHSEVVVSRCVPHGYRGHWTFAGVRYAVQSAAAANESLFDHCVALSGAFVGRQVATHTPPHGAAQRPFYLFSYFYDRAKDAGFMGDDDTGQPVADEWIISPRVYAQLARNACQPSSSSVTSSSSHRKGHKPYRQRPYLCLDLTYIYALLTRGFLFDDDTPLHLSKKINNIELGWALGAVFDLMHRTEKM